MLLGMNHRSSAPTSNASHRLGRRVTKILLLSGLGLLLIGIACAITIVRWPGLAARGADELRKLIGDTAVAQLESTVYGFQDNVNQQRYALGLKKVESPWAAQPVIVLKPQTSVRVAASSGASKALQAVHDTGSVTDSTAVATDLWKPGDVTPFTQADGEGKWQPYIQDDRGRVTAYRTFLSPDPKRPYAAIAVVAFDLHASRLNFVLGSQEPKSKVKIERPGTIPASDNQPGKLLAVFNGGWKAQHGHFGVMVNGTVVLPPVADAATLAMDADGTLRIGKWGQDGLVTKNTVIWRQNNVPLINNGEINPRTENMSIADWGSALNGNVAVWRSALGISQDGNTLFYAAGDSALVSAMTKALSAVDAYNAMQLDVNNYWVHFDAVRTENGALKPDALFPTMANSDNDRYLNGFTRDFFYVTANP